MLIGIVSDIHCNAEGLRQALQRMGPVDELLCAGDVISEYRFSNDVVELLRERQARIVQLVFHWLGQPAVEGYRGAYQGETGQPAQ